MKTITLSQLKAMDFDLNGFHIHYGEHTGVWWVDSLHGSLEGLKFRTIGEAVAWVEAQQ